MSKLLDSKQALQVLDLLDRAYPEAGCALHFEDHFELLCAVMLSAQTTDVSVNRITPELFRRYPDAFAMAKANRLPWKKSFIPLVFTKTKAGI